MIGSFKYYFLFCGIGLSLNACAFEETETMSFEALPSSETNINFSNNLSEGDSLNILNYVYYYNGGGVGIADVNNDGLEDIFFTGNEVSCRLYINKGDFQFEDITESAGLETSVWTTGVSMVDINLDGWIDIYVCASANASAELRKNLLFINQGVSQDQKLYFKESAEAYGIADTSYSTQAAFFDFDMDQDLDLYVMNHDNERNSVNTPLAKDISGDKASCDHLYMNEGNLHFSDVSKQAGIVHEGYGLGVAVSDINSDGWPDIYISNDFIYNDLLYINKKDGSFENQIGRYLKHQSYNGMGCDIADFNNDGFNDIVVLDMMPETKERQKTMAGELTNNKHQLILQMGYEPQFMRNTLQLNNGNNSFSEIGRMAGVYKTDWSWSALFADFDSDGWKDLFISNGYYRDITDSDFIDYNTHLIKFQSQLNADKLMLQEIRKMSGIHTANSIFQNDQTLGFIKKTKAWGLDFLSYSNGAAYADLDKDGDLDLIINNINEEASVLRNNSEKKNYLHCKLKGIEKNPTGIGAIVTLFQVGTIQKQEQNPYRGYQSTVSQILHFGLGENKTVDSLIVQWPDGNSQTLYNIPPNQEITLEYSKADKRSFEKLELADLPQFTDITNELGIEYTHEENQFNDFDYQGLLPKKFSQDGPKMAKGDLDGDGLIDFYICGASGISGKVFYQKPEGGFEIVDFGFHSESEDTDALIFDANGDKLNDLYVVSGGNEYPDAHELYKDRLYINKGTREFEVQTHAIPEMSYSGSCVRGDDFDQDGDIDLFVGGYIIPRQYPLSPQSILLKNEGGVFLDATKELIPEMKNIGMVTDAIWSDYNIDGLVDLILVGEWMPITVFENREKSFENQTDKLALSKTTGFWNVIKAIDLDQDGDDDFALGNLGLNTKFVTSEMAPLSIHAADFDNNGSLDAIISHYINGEESPEPGRNDLLNQIVSLETKYFRYSQYANAKVEDFFTKENLDNAFHRKVNYLESSILINNGNQAWELRSLPIEAQISPIYSFICEDFNLDGHPDLLLGGNFGGASISTGPFDAFIGLLLQGLPDGTFSSITVSESGFFIDGDVKDLEYIELNSGKKYIIVLNNQGPMQIFEHNILDKSI